MTHNQKMIGYCMTILGGMFWAVGGVCGSALFTYNGVVSNWMVPFRLCIAGAILLLASVIMGYPLFDIWKEKRDAVELLLFGVFGSAVCQYGYYTSVQYSNAAVGTVLSYTSPVLILLYLILRDRRAPRLYELLSVILVFFGAVVLATHCEFSTLSISPLALWWGIIGAAGFAFYAVEPARLLKKHHLPVVIGWGMILGGILLMCICHPWTISVTWSTSLVVRFAVVVVFGTILSFSCFQGGIRIVGSLAGSVLSSVEPVASVVLSAIFMHVAFLPMDLLGFAMILSTIPIIAVGDHRAAK